MLARVLLPFGTQLACEALLAGGIPATLVRGILEEWRGLMLYPRLGSTGDLPRMRLDKAEAVRSGIDGGPDAAAEA